MELMERVAHLERVGVGGGATWRNPSGFLLPPVPVVAPVVAPLVLHRRAVDDDPDGAGAGRLAWYGRLRARAWPDGFDEAEYRLMLVGGRKRRLARPDGYSVDGVPRWRLTDAEQRQRERALNRHALDIYETHNIACNAGRTALLNYVANAGGLTGVQYFAVGTGSAPAGQSGPSATDTVLWTEFYRQALSSTTISGSQIDLSSIFAAGSANTTYTEAGIFGDGATGTAGSGQLFAHALYAYTKSNTTVLTNDYYVTFN